MNFERLKVKILENSESKIFNEAKKEWSVVKKLDDGDDNCICSHDIYERFVIKNILNNNILKPIGNICIKNFEEEKMMLEVEELNKIFCNDCGYQLSNKYTYETHITSKKHIKNMGSKKCLDCDVRILNGQPEWKTRCVDCYKRVKNT